MVTFLQASFQYLNSLTFKILGGFFTQEIKEWDLVAFCVFVWIFFENTNFLSNSVGGGRIRNHNSSLLDYTVLFFFCLLYESFIIKDKQNIFFSHGYVALNVKPFCLPFTKDLKVSLV